MTATTTPAAPFGAAQQAAAAPARGSLPDGAGTNCYFSQSDCLSGPNPCTGQTECTADYTACSTGQAGPTAAWYFCARDAPVGSLPDGGGELCYDSAAHCFNGPNPCGVSSPCALDQVGCARPGRDGRGSDSVSSGSRIIIISKRSSSSTSSSSSNSSRRSGGSGSSSSS